MTVYYTDSTTPVASGSTLLTGITSKIEYELYEDSNTWTAWTAWANSNALNSNNIANFSARALHVKGTWYTFISGQTDNVNTWAKSFMCMEDKGTASNRGGWCVEASISTASSTTTYSSITYRATTANF